jgi:HAD superfamily hydrolase (TIGR01509 family)
LSRPFKELGKHALPEFTFKAVLFDMDGVILDSMEQHAASWLKVMANDGIQVSREFILAHEGCLADEVLARLLQEQGREPKAGEGVADFMGRLLLTQSELYLSDYALEVRPFVQAKPILASLSRAGVPTALVTSSLRSQVDQCLPSELRAGFTAIVTRNDVAQHKPHPEPYLTASQALQVRPEDCLVVENAPAGIAAGRAAGATCYAVCSTLDPEHLHEAHAVFKDLAELAKHLGLDGQG